MMKKILVTRSSMPELTEYVDEIRELFDSHWITNMGIKHEQFKQGLIDYLRIKNVELLTNGHMALELTLQAFDFKPGSEVITTPFTFASTTHAIVRNGLRPVFCDIRRDDYTLDADRLESLITDKTCAILPVHVYGNICEVEKISEIAKKHDLKVIYDAAHTFGEVYRGIAVGNFGDASCFSFHATKVFNTIEGGAVSYQDPHIGERLYDLKNFGIHGPYEVSGVGANAKLNEFCAAMGICNLRHIDEEIQKRSRVYEEYVGYLKNVPGILLNRIPEDLKSNYAYFPILVEEQIAGITRDDIYQALKKHNIFARKYFYPLTNTFSCYEGMFDVRETPVAKEISERILALPIYADLELQTVREICECILECRKQGA